MLDNVSMVVLIASWVAWLVAFYKPALYAGPGLQMRNMPAGFKIVLLSFALMLAYTPPWYSYKPWPLLVLGMILGPAAAALAWKATRHLGKQWRLEPSLTEDYELVQTGPYAWVRHPIYASILALILATGFIVTSWPMFAAGLIVFIVGTEMRIREEDNLLAETYPEAFPAYRSKVPAYIPFIH